MRMERASANESDIREPGDVTQVLERILSQSLTWYTEAMQHVRIQKLIRKRR